MILYRQARRQDRMEIRPDLLSGLTRVAIVRAMTTSGTPIPQDEREQQSRYAAAQVPEVAEGWRLERLTAPSRLFGANGLRTGPDGRIYIAQVTGSQISALDINTGDVETISAKGGDIIAPDYFAFDSRGNLVAT